MVRPSHDLSRLLCIVAVYLSLSALAAPFPVVTTTNASIRVMASNLTSGNSQRYETAGLNILKGLKPDVVAMQEFNYLSPTYGTNDSAYREMVDNTFGTNFYYFRESGVSIPNGVISRYPIIASGIWDDVQVPDRNFVWARIDLPGTNDLYVVSVHLHSSGGSSSRATEASNLKAFIQANFPADAWIVVAGDFNTDSRGEQAITTFKTFLSDSPVPTDAVTGGDPDTNATRSKPYDYVLPSFTFDTNRVATVIGAHTFNNGLVFDSRVYTPLSEVSPVQTSDSGAVNMQHMGVVKDFKITYTVTNYVEVISPRLTLISTNIVRWSGVSNLTYSVHASTNLPAWTIIGSAPGTGTNFSFTNQSGGRARFYRVSYP